MNDKFKVLWIYQRMSTTNSGLKVESGQLPSLCFKGRKKMLCVAAGHPVRVIVREAADFDKMRSVMRGTKVKVQYPIDDAVARFKGIGKRCGITEAAKKLLARAEALEDVENDDKFENEEEVVMIDESKTVSTTEGASEAQERKKVTKTKKTKPAAAAEKTKPAVAAKKTKPAVAAKKTKPVAAAKKPAAKGDGLGREGSLTRFMNERLLKGESNDVISKAAKAKFPDSNTTEPSNVSWYRWNATRKGILKA